MAKNNLRTGLATRRTWTAAFALIILALLALGYGAAQWRAGLADRELREGLLHQARAIARTIDTERVKSLAFTAADKERPEFRRLREQMRGYQTMIPCRGIYTLALRDGQLQFGPESYAEGDPQASPPGTIYRQPTPEVRAMFQTRRAFTEGPAADEYGTFVSAFAPVLDPRSGEVLMVVGLDVEAADWQSILARARLVAILWVLLPGAILLGGIFVLRRQNGLPVERQRRRRYPEVYLVAALGMALTLVASLAFHDSEARSRRASFRQLSLANTGRVLSTFENLRDHKLDALTRFFEGSQDVDQNEFRVFAEPLARGNDIQAVEWIRPVPAARKAALEQQARAAGRADFIIWQRGADGRREPALGRPVYYPVWYVEPLQGNEVVLGYDVGSEPLRRAALVAALETGLSAATDPLVLVQEKEDLSGLLVFHPVFSGKPPVRTLRGFALALVRLHPFLQAALSDGLDDDTPVAMDMYQLQAGHTPRFLASSSPGHTARHREAGSGEGEMRPAHSDFSVVFPLFIFGKSYALLFHPLPAFLAANPQRDGWTTALVGLLLTALLTTFAVFLLRRRADLEIQVQARTAQLQESEDRYRDLVENIHDLICTHDLEGKLLAVNQAALKLLGYESREIMGKNIRDLLAPGARPEFDEYLTTIRREGAARGLMVAQTRTGEKRLWEYDNTLRTEGVPRPIVRGLARDITERVRAEAAREQLEA
ncbi:MAG: CHASE domain-containing protein, partial [Smithellaceae bacterium]|nr:CHASE domain-containing protein [Smithellaceae bacterium]